MKVRFAGIDYRVREFGPDAPADTNLKGQFDSNNCTIQLSSVLPGGLYRETFLHEIIHLVDNRLSIGLSERKTALLAALRAHTCLTARAITLVFRQLACLTAVLPERCASGQR